MRWFDLAADPGERRPVREGPELERAEEELARILRRQDGMRARLGSSEESIVLPDSMREALEGLGYVWTAEDDRRSQ